MMTETRTPKLMTIRELAAEWDGLTQFDREQHWDNLGDMDRTRLEKILVQNDTPPASTVASLVLEKNGGIAALISVVLPGGGHMYAGEIGSGIGWLIFTLIGYGLFVVPGLVLHLVCIFDAVAAVKRIGKKSKSFRLSS